MEIKTLFFYLIVAIAIAAFVIAIVAVVQSNNNSDAIKALQNESVNYTALVTGNTKIEDDSLGLIPTKAISITLPTDNWAYTGANLGVLGNVYITTNNPTATITWNVTYTKNGGTEEPLSGAVDFTTGSAFLVNLNGVATGTNGVIMKGDAIVINLYATASAATIITNDPQLIDAAVVYGPVNA
jgi:hypothetical protein